MQDRELSIPDKDLPLRSDVSTLGAIVGEVLVEQYGPEVFACVESLRKAAIARREGNGPDLASIAGQVAEADRELVRKLVRGFSGYFQVVNIAERVHRIRRIRDSQRDGEPLADSLLQTLAELSAAGLQPAAIQALFDELVIEPVMTAHPTEATRRTLLNKEREIARQLVGRFDTGRTPQEERRALERIRQEVTVSWQTRAYSAAKTTVEAEREHVLFYISDILYEVVPVFYESLRTALNANFPGVCADAPLPRLLRFGSWVGGDMDGNPNVDHRTLAASLTEHRRLILERYIQETGSLAETLTQSLSEIDIADAVLHRVRDYRQLLPETARGIAERLVDMPYRSLLVYARARLQATLDEAAGAYGHCREFMADIELIRDSLLANRGTHAGLFKVERLLCRIRTFGFWLATLDVRQDAAELRLAAAELLGIADWEQRPVDERIAVLRENLQSPPPLPESPGPSLTRVLAVLTTIHQSQQQYDAAAIGPFIISMAQGADDVLTVLLLARVTSLADDNDHVPLDVAPLLETVNDLEQGEALLRQLAALDCYRAHLSRRQNRQLVMIGYSDSSKDGGIASARWALYGAQERMSSTARELDLRLGFFHGRGGSVSRGGGNMVRGIYAAPAGSVAGYMRITEQGEVIHQKYGIRATALRNLEQITSATLATSLRGPRKPDTQWADAMQTLADASRARYRALVHESPGFAEYFRQATPIDVIERLQIGSRPSSRRAKAGIRDLRAIPWVFSWAQVRIGLPGVFGVGTGLAAAVDAHGVDTLRAMLQWPFFSGLISDIEMVLAKSDLDIGERYSALADDDLQPTHDVIANELRQAQQLLLEIKQVDQLLDEDPTLQRAIRLRNPYVDPLNLLQIKLLREWRAGDRRDDELLSALFDTVNGIARGIQNTG